MRMNGKLLKTGTTVLIALSLSVTAKAQESWFNKGDVDENGWLWFDSQAIIDKYVGPGKLIELEPATYENGDGENPEPYASATVKGAGPDGVQGTEGCRTGAIVLCESNGINAQTGGAILMHLPSCLDMALFLSSEDRMLTAIYGGKGNVEVIDLAIVQGKCAAPFVKLSSAGQYVYQNMANVENANTGLKLYSQNPVTACFRNCNNDLLYIHGIKVTVKDGQSGISRIDGIYDNVYYNLLGRPEMNPTRGIYILNGRKVFIE